MRSRVSLVLLCLVVFLPALAGMAQVSGLFAEGRYEDARTALATSGDEGRPGEGILWRSRLEQDPDKADALLVTGLAEPSLPPATKAGLALQLAILRYARQDHQGAYEILEPFLAEEAGPLPGEGIIIAALTQRAAGNLQRARELLAGIKPEDPAFTTARYFLGDIGLQKGENELALRYFESGARRGATEPRLKAGQWRALRAEGQDQEAEGILAGLQQNHPSCLALVEIDRVLRSEEDENQARLSAHQEAPDDTLATAPVAAGRYALQLGAFSDRSLALDFQRRQREIFPDLKITEVRDAQGQFLYKVRTGSFVNPALARSEARRLQNEHNLEIIVVETEASFGDDR